MHQIHPDTSLVAILRRIATGDLHYHLYRNDVTPDRDTELGDLTEMGAGTGYAVITVEEADFTTEGVSAHKGTIIAPPVTFEIGAGSGIDDIYGYFVTDDTDALLIACGRFDDAPIDITAGADIPVTPILGDSSQFSS